MTISWCTLGIVLGLAATPAAAPAQTKPDFSGSWKLDALRSRLDAIPALKNLVIKIDHHEPKIRVELEGTSKPDEAGDAFDLTTDGAESKQVVGEHSCAASAHWDQWTGTRLVLTITCDTPNGPVVTNRRMKLGGKGKMMTTVLTMKGSGANKNGYEFYVKQQASGT